VTAGIAAGRVGRRRLSGALLAALIGVVACGRTLNDAPTSSAAGKGNAGAAGAGAGSQAGSGGAEPVSCNLLPCPPLECQIGPTANDLEPGMELVVPQGECCPVCRPVPSCSAVSCLFNSRTPALDCPPGYDVGTSPGACCRGCVPNGEPFEDVFCGDPDCPNSPVTTPCPAGYYEGLLAGRCCSECVPDPRTCSDDSDCLLALRSDDCCDCPQAISTRLYEHDACWSALEQLRPVPFECPLPVCDVITCVGCTPKAARCVNNRCEQEL
jgi:hypothetical protein